MVIKIGNYHKANILTKKTYLMNMITDLQISDKWKVQLTNAFSFISSKDAENERVM